MHMCVIWYVVENLQRPFKRDVRVLRFSNSVVRVVHAQCECMMRRKTPRQPTPLHFAEHGNRPVNFILSLEFTPEMLALTHPEQYAYGISSRHFMIVSLFCPSGIR